MKIAEPTTVDPESDSRPEIDGQIRGSSLLLFGRILSLVTNLGVQVLLVRSLSKADFGMFAYALAIISTIGILVTFGLDRGLARFLAIFEERGDRARFWGTIALQLGTIFGLGLAAVAVVVGLQGWIGTSVVDDDRLAALLAVMVILAPIQALDQMAGSVFAVFGKSRAIFLRRYIVAPLARLTIIGLLVASDGSVYFLGAGYVAAGLFGLAVYGSLLKRLFHEKGLLNRPAYGPRVSVPFAEIGAFTGPLLISDLMFVVLNTSDVVILGRTAGAAAVASYRAVLPVARLNQLVMNSFSLLFAPLMARMWTRGDREGLHQAYWQTAAWVAVLSFPLFALTFGLAEPITVGLFGDRYSSSVPYLQVLGLAYYFNASLGFNGVTLKMAGRVWLVAATAGAALVFNLGANLLLIPRYGAMGAAIGTASSIAVYNIMKQWALHRGTGVALFDRQYLSLYATIVAATASLLVLDPLGAANILRLGVVILASIAVLLMGRRVLAVGEVFPQLRRVPLVGRLLVSGGRKR